MCSSADGLSTRRLRSTDKDKNDYISYILKKPKEERLSDEVLLTNIAGFVGAGSETVSIVMTGLVFFLASERSVYQKLAHEIRGAFFSVHLITAAEVQKLPYLNAVVKETLRMYSAVPVGGNRVSPGAMVDERWIPSDVGSNPIQPVEIKLIMR